MLAGQSELEYEPDWFQTTSKNQLVQDIKNRKDSFLRDLELHHSVDTLARKYFVKYGVYSEELRFLKVCVSLFILYRQYRYGLDPRYDLFFAAVGSTNEQGRFILPDNVNIVSWNYDTQLELSYSSFINGMKVVSSKIDLNLHPRLKHHGEEYGKVDLSRFSTIKLNGSSDVISEYDINNSELSLSNQKIGPSSRIDFSEIGLERGYDNHKFHLFEKLLMFYDETMNKSDLYSSLLSFSWESDERLVPARDAITEIAHRTGVLVIIGYSFPTFNRKIDDQLIWELTDGKPLRKIYIQTKGPDSFESIKNKIGTHFRRKNMTTWENFIEFVPQLDEFYVPYEMG
jgi:hypothetical protein